MTIHHEDELPANIRRGAELKGINIAAWTCVHLPEKHPDRVTLFHLGGVKDLLVEAKDTLLTYQVLASNPDAIPREQPKGFRLMPLPSVRSPDDLGQFDVIPLQENYPQARVSMHEQVRRMAFGHALSKVYVALTNPDGSKARQKWSREFTLRWLDANKSMYPAYKRYLTPRNQQEAHRGYDEDIGGVVSAYVVATDRDCEILVNVEPNSELHFDPTDSDITALSELINNAEDFVRLETDEAENRVADEIEQLSRQWGDAKGKGGTVWGQSIQAILDAMGDYLNDALRLQQETGSDNTSTGDQAKGRN